MRTKVLLRWAGLLCVLNVFLYISVVKDQQYIRDLAYRIISPDQPELEIVRAVVHYLRNDVRNLTLDEVEHLPWAARLDFRYNPFRAGPQAILEYGKHHLGPCQSSSRAAIALLAAFDIPARIVALHDDHLIGMHSVVEVDYEGRSGIVSPTYGFVYRLPDGRPATLKELKRDQQVFLANARRGFAYGVGPKAKEIKQPLPVDDYNFDNAYYFNYRWLGLLRKPVVEFMRAVFGEDSLYWLPYPGWYTYPAHAAMVFLDAGALTVLAVYWFIRRRSRKAAAKTSASTSMEAARSSSQPLRSTTGGNVPARL